MGLTAARCRKGLHHSHTSNQFPGRQWTDGDVQIAKLPAFYHIIFAQHFNQKAFYLLIYAPRTDRFQELSARATSEPRTMPYLTTLLTAQRLSETLCAVYVWPDRRAKNGCTESGLWPNGQNSQLYVACTNEALLNPGARTVKLISVESALPVPEMMEGSHQSIIILQSPARRVQNETHFKHFSNIQDPKWWISARNIWIVL